MRGTTACIGHTCLCYAYAICLITTKVAGVESSLLIYVAVSVISSHIDDLRAIYSMQTATLKDCFETKF